MQKDILCGLDIGSSKICASCGRVGQTNKLDVLAAQTIPTEGMRGGKIIDGAKLTACIREIFRRMRKMNSIKVRRVYLNIDHPDLEAKASEEKIMFTQPTTINKSQIQQLVNAAVSAYQTLARDVLYADVQNFILDGQVYRSLPNNRLAQDFKINLLLVTSPAGLIKDVHKCIRNAGLIVAGMAPSVCAQALGFSSQLSEEKENILLDIGSMLTKIIMFKNRLVQNLAILSLGAQNVTQEIAQKFNLSVECAEQLKIEYGRLSGESRFLHQRIIVQDHLAQKTISAQKLQEIVALTVDQLLEKIKETISGLSGEDKYGGVIVTGAGAILEGFIERAEQVLEKPVKMGFLSQVKDNQIQTQSAVYATSIGLIHFGLKKEAQPGFFVRKKITVFTPLAEKAKRFYQEYF